jgi:tetratricopeptide (TPR) repeat protein
MRRRLDRVAGKWFSVLTREKMNEALLQYAYPADAVLPPSVARTLAAALQARFLVSSTLSRNESGRYALHVRAVGMNDKAGYSFRLPQEPNQSLEDFGKVAADQMESAFKGLAEAKKCWDQQLDKPEDAKDAAEKALREQPNHGLAEFCLGEIAVAQNAPKDAIIAHYRNATLGDPQSLDTWAALAVQYEALGDSANTVQVYQQMLSVAPTNQPLREQAFRLFLNYGRPGAARQVAEKGLEIDPGNAELWDLKSNACLFLEDFPCAVDALEMVFEVDSARADSNFYNKISVSASQQPDTARLLKWAERGANKYPTNPTMLAHLVTAYSYAGPIESAIRAVQRLMAVDSSDLRPVLKTIQALATEKRLLESDVMGAYIERLGSPDDKQAYAGLLTNGALAMLQQPENQDLLPGAASLARKAVGLSVPGGQVAVNANYILGLATVLQLPGRDQPIMDGKSCELAEESRAILEEASTSLELGKSASEAVAQYIQMANQFRPRIESQVKAFCK